MGRQLDEVQRAARSPLLWGIVVAVVGPTLVTAVILLLGLEGRPGPPTIYLLVVVLATSVGGFVPGLLASAISLAGLVGFGTRSQQLDEWETILMLTAFVTTSLIVGYLLNRLQRALRHSEQLAQRERLAREQAVRISLQTAAMERLALALSEARSADELATIVATELPDTADAPWAALQPLPWHHPSARRTEPTWAVPVDELPHATAVGARSAGVTQVAALPPGTLGSDAVLLVGLRPVGPWLEDHRRFMRMLAREVGASLERLRTRDRERAVSETLQRSLLPSGLPEPQGGRVRAVYLPATRDLLVGGDWYDAVQLGESRTALVIGDVVGHGLEAAVTMGRLRDGLRAFLYEGSSPAEALARLNDLVTRTKRGDLTTVVVLIADISAGSVVLANAGHLPPLVLGPRPGFVHDARSLPLGVEPDTTYSETALELGEAETLLLYTDGLVERRGSAIDDRLAQLEATAQAAWREGADPMRAAIDDLGVSVLRDDDVAVVALEIAAVSPAAARAAWVSPAAQQGRSRGDLLPRQGGSS